MTQKTRLTKHLSIMVISAIVVVSMFGYAYIVISWYDRLNTLHKVGWGPAEVGDALGAVSAVFTALAFVGITAAYFKEKESLEILKQDVAITKMQVRRASSWESLSFVLNQFDQHRESILKESVKFVHDVRSTLTTTPRRFMDNLNTSDPYEVTIARKHVSIGAVPHPDALKIAVHRAKDVFSDLTNSKFDLLQHWCRTQEEHFADDPEAFKEIAQYLVTGLTVSEQIVIVYTGCLWSDRPNLFNLVWRYGAPLKILDQRDVAILKLQNRMPEFDYENENWIESRKSEYDRPYYPSF